MDDYLTDKEQFERLRQWWSENGWFLIGGLAIGLLALYGYRQYNAYRDGQSESAAVLYEAVKTAVDAGNAAAAETSFDQLRTDHPSHAYTYQAALLVARAEVVTAPDKAAEHLRLTMEGTDDPDLAMVARLRLARVLAYREQYDDALKLLETESPGQFAGRLSEIKGDIHLARGDADAARTAYLEAMIASGADLLDRTYLQMKLADLPARPETPPETATEPPAGAPAEGTPKTAEEGA